MKQPDLPFHNRSFLSLRSLTHSIDRCQLLVGHVVRSLWCNAQVGRALATDSILVEWTSTPHHDWESSHWANKVSHSSLYNRCDTVHCRLDTDRLVCRNGFVWGTKQADHSDDAIFSAVLTTQHISGMRMFRDMKLCALARNVPIFDGLIFVRPVGVELNGRLVVTGVDGVKVFCSARGLASFGRTG